MGVVYFCGLLDPKEVKGCTSLKWDMVRTPIEERTVCEASSVLIGPSLKLTFRHSPGKWTIVLYHEGFPHNYYCIRALHSTTGAQVPVLEPLIEKSLGRARNRAEQLATVLRGSMEPFKWRE